MAQTNTFYRIFRTSGFRATPDKPFLVWNHVDTLDEALDYVRGRQTSTLEPHQDYRIEEVMLVVNNTLNFPARD